MTVIKHKIYGHSPYRAQNRILTDSLANCNHQLLTNTSDSGKNMHTLTILKLTVIGRLYMFDFVQSNGNSGRTYKRNALLEVVDQYIPIYFEQRSMQYKWHLTKS